jgi:hypothetical protein
MNVATSSKTGQMEFSAAVFAPVKPEDFYEAVLDVRGFPAPAWTPGVRRFGALSGEGGAGTLSEWEVSFLGFRKTVSSVLLVRRARPSCAGRTAGRSRAGAGAP